MFICRNVDYTYISMFINAVFICRIKKISMFNLPECAHMLEFRLYQSIVISSCRNIKSVCLLCWSSNVRRYRYVGYAICLSNWNSLNLDAYKNPTKSGKNPTKPNFSDKYILWKGGTPHPRTTHGYAPGKVVCWGVHLLRLSTFLWPVNWLTCSGPTFSRLACSYLPFCDRLIGLRVVDQHLVDLLVHIYLFVTG